MLRTAGHLAAYYVLRPVIARLPPAAYAAGARAAAVPFGLAFAAKHRRRIARILRLVGRPAGPAGVLGYGLAAAHERIRHVESYFYGRTPNVRVAWDGPPADGPGVYVLANTFGFHAVAEWMDANPGVMVRQQWDGESAARVADAPPRLKWRAHQAALRQATLGWRQVIIGDNPLAYRRVADGSRSLVIFQDIWADGGKPRPHALFGQPTPLLLGAPRLAAMAGGLPVRFLTIEHAGVRGWVVTASPPLDPTPAALADRIEQEIRRRPAAWMMWDAWLDYQDDRAVARPPAAADPAPAARLAPQPAPGPAGAV